MDIWMAAEEAYKKGYDKGYEDAVRQVKEDIIKKLRIKQQWYLNLYDEFLDGEDYRKLLLLEKVIDIVKEC